MFIIPYVLFHWKNKDDGFLYLDNTYSDIVSNSWVILKNQERYDAYKINEINQISLNDFELNYKVNVLQLDGLRNLDQYTLHETTAYIGSKRLTLAQVLISIPISNSDHPILLEKKMDGLKEKQNISITGELENDPNKSIISEISQIISVQTDLSGKYTEFKLPYIKNKYKWDTVTFNFNIVKATHGETKHEVLGSGNPSHNRQKFVLKGKPLTYVLPDINDSGSTLEANVGNKIWTESDNFLNLKSDDRSYITHVADDGNVSLIFGDGICGMRPSAGLENIHVNYWLGMGKDGLIQKHKINLLLNRPSGVHSVTNPIPATNATDSEDLSTAKKMLR